MRNVYHQISRDLVVLPWITRRTQRLRSIVSVYDYRQTDALHDRRHDALGMDRMVGSDSDGDEKPFPAAFSIAERDNASDLGRDTRWFVSFPV